MKINLLYTKLRNLYVSKVKYFYLSTTKPEYKLLLNNSRFKDKYRGKTCFILGNGPSLKDVNFKVLKDEYVFTVNQISRRDDFCNLNPNFHFWMDENFFVIDESKPEDIELLSTMRNVNTSENKPECFFPISQYQFIKKYNLDRELNVNYIFSNIEMYDGYNKKIDFTRDVPAFGTVVQWCIEMAVYMGFSQIVLLGCDNTGIITSIRSAMQCNDDTDYSYKVTENEKKRMENMVKRNSLEKYVEAYLSTMKSYRYLNRYCSDNNVELINCSEQTAIDCIRRGSLSTILNTSRR